MYRLLTGDCREVLATLPAQSAQTCVTSPPYFGLRAYLPDGHPDKAREIGLEQTPDAYVAELVAVFREVRRVLADDGCVWLNLGDSYAANRPYQVSQSKHKSLDYGTSNATICPPGLKPKDLIGIPWRVAFALQVDGWYLRSDIIWHKPNPMPESVRDRPTKAHEYVFLLSKQERYFYNAAAIAEAGAEPRIWAKETRGSGDEWRSDGGSASRAAKGATGFGTTGTRNARSVWTITPKPFRGAHFATFPPALAERCIKAGSRPGDVVLDPFAGAGTTLLVAAQLQRLGIGIELNPAYAAMAEARIADAMGMLAA